MSSGQRLTVLPRCGEPVALREVWREMAPFIKAETEGYWTDGCGVFSSPYPGHFPLRRHGSRILIQSEISS